MTAVFRRGGHVVHTNPGEVMLFTTLVVMCVSYAYTGPMAITRADAKVERLHVRLSPADDGLIRRAAEAEHVSLSEFVIRSARTEAMRVLTERTSVTISAAEWDALDARLAEPGIVKPDVSRLFAKPAPFDG